MPCTDCEKLQGVAPGAICANCVRTLAYLASQDEACLANAHEQLLALYASRLREVEIVEECCRIARAQVGIERLEAERLGHTYGGFADETEQAIRSHFAALLGWHSARAAIAKAEGR